MGLQLIATYCLIAFIFMLKKGAFCLLASLLLRGLWAPMLAELSPAARLRVMVCLAPASQRCRLACTLPSHRLQSRARFRPARRPPLCRHPLVPCRGSAAAIDMSGATD